MGINRRSHTKRTNKPIRIFQANVAKTREAHNTALALAERNGFDLVMIQEPLTEIINGECKTVNNRAYDTYGPVHKWKDTDTRPRVMTYVRRASCLPAEQLEYDKCRDILILRVAQVTYINIYRQTLFDGALELLFARNIAGPHVVAGDFNACHHSWQADTQRHRGEIVEEGALWLPGAVTTTDELDEAARQLSELLADAINTVGHPPKKSSPSTRWWNEECTEAHEHLLEVRRRHPLGFCKEVQSARREFRRACRRIKRRSLNGYIDNISEPKDIWPMCRWVHSRGAFQSPPIEFNGEVFVTQAEKARALRMVTLERRTAADDIEDPWRDITPKRKLQFCTTVTYEEAQHAATSTGNTSPGSDNITVALIKACWLSIGEYTRRLYEACLRLGHHPPVFKQAEVVMIPKPNKRDLTSPRSWRPISLLSCLSKGLERLIAGRLAYAAIGQDVLHPQQIGALPKRSAVDLVAALIHEIEAALDAGLVATLVTMDVVGAFDAVMRNRLLLRLREQGWPPSLARWAGSFMTDRRAKVRLQDTVTEMAPLSCGLPQGSPASPILFLLYTEPIYRLGAQTFSHPSIKVTAQPARRFGYADDTAMLRIGRTLKDTANESDGDISDLTGWGERTE
ncbi:hypothetical protein MRS44_018084 [Fusarium solani]|uniref:uncharacterized protein n=1 Tax=Fusarium solani TaxID=169388 RepID=UPI0032C40519|nr:hypothetical protein MRS44_018084 [Fusarium solani]